MTSPVARLRSPVAPSTSEPPSAPTSTKPMWGCARRPWMRPGSARRSRRAAADGAVPGRRPARGCPNRARSARPRHRLVVAVGRAGAAQPRRRLGLALLGVGVAGAGAAAQPADESRRASRRRARGTARPGSGRGRRARRGGTGAAPTVNDAGDAAELAVDVAQHGERVGALGAGVVRHLVVAEQVDVDRRPPLGDVVDDALHRHVAADDGRERPQQGVRPAPLRRGAPRRGGAAAGRPAARGRRRRRG